MQCQDSLVGVLCRVLALVAVSCDTCSAATCHAPCARRAIACAHTHTLSERLIDLAAFHTCAYLAEIVRRTDSQHHLTLQHLRRRSLPLAWRRGAAGCPGGALPGGGACVVHQQRLRAVALVPAPLDGQPQVPAGEARFEGELVAAMGCCRKARLQYSGSCAIATHPATKLVEGRRCWKVRAAIASLNVEFERFSLAGHRRVMQVTP